MTPALLDVNVLLSLLDSDHVDHGRATRWLDREISSGWASCAITENGFVHIISQPSYPSPVSPAVAIGLLSQAAAGVSTRAGRATSACSTTEPWTRRGCTATAR